MVWKDDNSSVETAYTADADGKETVTMEITRKRGGSSPTTTATPIASTGAPSNASATTTASTGTAVAAAPALSPVQAALARSLGTWNVVARMTSPDGTELEEKATEVCSAVCNGLWQWTDYEGQFMGSAFEGHALIAHDPDSDQITTYWIDSSSPFVTKMTGKYDVATKTMTGSGKSCDPNGDEGTITEKITWKDDNTRVNQMTATGKMGTMTWEMTSRRAPQTGGYKIK